MPEDSNSKRSKSLILNRSKQNIRPEMLRGRNPIRLKQCTGSKIPGERNLEGSEKGIRPEKLKNPSQQRLEEKKMGPGKFARE